MRIIRSIIIAVVAIVSAYALTQTGSMVLAYRSGKIAHVFPQTVGTVGWTGSERAIAQDLSHKASVDAFTNENAATIAILPSTPAGMPDVVPELTPSANATDATDPVPDAGEEEVTPEETVPENEAIEEPAAPETETTGDAPSEPAPGESEPETGAPTSEPVPVEPTPETSPAAEPPAEAAPEPSAGSWGDMLLSHMGTTVFAQDAESEETDVPEEPIVLSGVSDVATCTITGEPCYTLQVSGFGIEGGLRAKEFSKATLSFSFAHRSLQDSESKLAVRYFHAGRWRDAGDIFLTGDVSNGTNGGYFTSELTDIEAWEDLSDVIVEFEYENSGAAELYLDAAWIDVEYKERAQDIFGPDELPEDTSGNVVEELAARDIGDTTLTEADGSMITFPFTDDDSDESILMKTDRGSYDGRITVDGVERGRDTVYVALTNTSVSDDVQVRVSLPAGATLVEAYQFLKNVPREEVTEVRENVSYFCEAGWEKKGKRYECKETGMIEACSWLNEAGDNCLVEGVLAGSEESTVYTSDWVLRSSVNVSRGEDATSTDYMLAEPVAILAGQTIFLKFIVESQSVGVQEFLITAEGVATMGAIDSRFLADPGAHTAMKKQKPKKDPGTEKVNKRLSHRTEFDGDELPEFKFKFASQKSFFTRFKALLLREDDDFHAVARIERAKDGKQDIPVHVEYGENGEWTVSFEKKPRSFKPGLYTLELTMNEAGATFTDSVEFYWGVLAVNPNRSIYEAGEEAQLSMAVLDDVGNTICDAITDLVITDPNGISQTVAVEPSPECGPNNVIDVPDYTARYQTGALGTYTILFSHLDENGVAFHRVTDSFEVRDPQPFSVERVGPTRIYPKAPYTMELRVTAREDFDGVVREPMPEGFIVLDKAGGDIKEYGDTLELFWNLTIAAGETKVIRYEFDAPDISPYTYLLGPLSMEKESGNAYLESRTWKIASDALGEYIEKSSSWSPTGAGAWEVKDLSGAPFNVPAGAIAEIAILNSDPNNEAVGGVRHASSSLNRFIELHEPEPQGVTVATMHVQVSATSSIQTYAEDTADISFILLGYWTSGYYQERFDQIDPNNTAGTWGNINLNSVASGVVSGTVAEMMVANWDTGNQLLGGVRALGSSLNRYVDLHEAEGAGGGTQGVEPVSMMVRASTTSGTIQGYAQTEGANGASIDYYLLGYWNQNPTGLDYTERFDTLTGPTSNSTWTNEPLDSYGVPPTGIAETVYAYTAASDSSILIGVRTDGSALSRTQNLHEQEGGGWSVGHAHVKAGSDASSTIEFFTEDTANDAYRLIGYWAADDYPADAPTLYDEPFDNEKTGTSTPTFLFSASDPDGTSDIVYQIQWDDDPTLDDVPIGDRSSDNESGCSPNCFVNATNPGDTSPFTEGDQVRFSIQTALVSGTTYYWRVRATDVNGSNIASEWSDVRSFTYVANTDPQQWFQTQDTQFDTGTLSGTETYGSNSVRLVSSAPTDALIAYGEGTVQTPRYRFWDADADQWGAEASASSVGGTIQWIVTKAATTRNEYLLGTQDASSDVNIQVYNGTTTTWGNLQEVTATIADTTARGFDIAYETLSGRALVVFCDGDADPSYYIWNGFTWAGPTPMNVGSANNCEWIRLASDPTSNDIVMVTRDTGSVYEAQVWDGSAWANSQTLGSMTDTAHEGIAVEYEESGEQALVVVSNGDTAGFVWTAWDGALQQWSTPVPQSLGDDFEWGHLAQDDGSDQLGLCYADEDDDMGSLIWDGSAWATFAAATQEYELTGTTNTRGGGGTIEGHPFSCQFETTSGRDGYLMIPYSDTTAGRYTFWNGTSHATEASVSTIQDSWSVYSARTGDGTILAAFHDDINGRFDTSYWNGSTWGTAATIENSPSVTAAPFREPVSIVARKYQASSGTITSDPVSFSYVSGQPSWGEAVWETTEPGGTDVKMQVAYGSSCASLVPDSALPGNSSGFDLSSSPLDLSTISTSTYSQLCLKATLSSTNTSVPTLDSWTISWERQPYLTQAHYRWYANTNALTPTDPWPSGANDLSEDTAISTSFAPIPADVLRLRLSILNENVSLSSSALTLKLQYALTASCSVATNWLDVGDIGSTTAKWRGYDNASPSDGATLASRLLSTTDVSATYEEENDSTANPSSAAANEELEYDWVLQHNASSSEPVCFRVITAAGEELNEYDVYPTLITNAAPSTPALEKLFDNEQVASTTPWFEFVAEDPESNDLTYQIQIDDTYDFSSTVLDRNSQTNFTEFENIITPADKDPFTSGQTVRFKPTTSLSDGTTYYWRVRTRDRNASGEWSSWSTIQSFTVNTGTTITTWYQTTEEQFATDSFADTEATSTDDVVLTPPLTTGTTTSTSIDFDWRTTGNAWGALSWNDTEPVGSSVTYRVQYWTGSAWAYIPDTALAGNAAGFTTSPISLLSISPTTYNVIRLHAVHATSGTTPRLLDWTVTWGEAVEQPTQVALFDNEKTGTTTPTFRFYSDDPQDNDLIYEISISADNTFTGASTTRSSDLHGGFSNSASSTDTSPFVAGDTIEFELQPADALTNGTTYWWRVRARDPAPGADVWSTWSDLRSFTVDTTVIVSTWFQTTDEQFETDTLTDTEVYGSDTLRIASISREAFTAYAEGTALVPKYRLWNGSSWSDEASGQSVGNTIRFVESAAAPTRDEYVIATMDSVGGIRAQIYDGDTDTTGDLSSTLSVVSDATQRGYDVAYETTSGDAMVVACFGTEATYATWNGSSWSATSTITLSVSTNCEWVKLAADPTSDEIIAVFRDATTGATDYEAYVWNGSSWGNNTTFGSQATANNEGIAVEYEESGNQAIVAVSNGINNNFIYNIWNGGWSGTNTVTTGNDFAGGRLKRDVGTDRLALCYTDIDNDLGFFVWSGSAWDTTLNEYEPGGNNFNGRPVTCEFETEGARDGYLMIPYSDTIQAEYVYWTGAGAPTAPAVLTTITDSWEMRSTRTGDGNVLVVAYDDANTEYDFTYWNGTSWSDEQVLESTSITTVTPATIPLDIVSRRYPSFTSGTVVSSAIDFDDGNGPKWDYFSWNDTTPGSSDILYQVEYFTSTSSWALIPEADLPGNTAGTSTSPFDLGNLNRTTYNTLRLRANFECVLGDCPTMADWTLAWSEGITVSGTAQQYDQSTNVTSGTVAVAVNGELQSGKTATISGGTWSIPNVTVFADDVVTVFISGAADANEAAAVMVYDGDGDITGVTLYERHLSIGSNENPTVTNANLSQYDYSASLNNEDIFFDVDAGNDLDACAITGCDDVEIWVKSGSTYRPDSTSSGNVSTHDIEVNGTLTMDGNTFTIEGSWDNNGTTTPATSSIIFTATSTYETIDSTSAVSASLNNVTFGQTSGAATWTLGSALDVNGTMTITYGTTSLSSYPLNVASNLTINTNGRFLKGTATTTFDGTGSSTWTDNTSTKQDLGIVAIDGTSKTVALGAGAKATDLTIGSDDTFTAGSSYALEIAGNFTNNNVFTPQSGTVTFTATDTGNTITPGNSSFNNITFDGSGGNWSFIGTGVTAAGNFTITNGIVTLSSGTTTVAGNFDSSGGTFMHNNGAVLLNASASRVITPGTSSFYDLAFNGSGSWSFGQANATSSRHTTITLGTVTLPSGTHAVGGNFARNGGSFAHNSGTLKFTASSAQTIRLNGTDAYNLSFAGIGGSWSFVDTNATSTNTVRFDNGTATLPSGVFAVGGSWIATSGAFSHNSGIVRFNSGDTGETVTPGNSSFSQLLFANALGGWTISANATSTASTTLSSGTITLASGATLEVGGTFTNLIGGASTTWSGSTLYLNSGTAYSANTKSAGGDVYDALRIGANTDVKMWNASSTNPVVASNGSLYIQDHGAIDGALYIWGEYVSNGNEYWSYATDFDGTALGVGSREVLVRIGNGSSVSHGASTLAIVGTSTATTTIAAQGSGSYSMTVSGGTVTAQFYAIRDLSSSGLVLTGSPTISSLSNGRFELTQNGGTALTLGPTVIDANTALEIQQVEFATTTAITGTNVHATGTPSSYWWFRNHYGNLDGEQFDNDPTGDPGNVRWDDSGFTITIAGRVFANDKTSAIGNPPCDGSTSVVRVVVNGVLPGLAGSCDASTGAYSIPGVSFSGDAVITTYLDTNGGARAVTVSRTPTADILDMNLYQNAVTARHEGVDGLTIDNLAVLDSSDDEDIPFTATSGSPDVLSLRSGTELHIYTGKTFAPGGNTTLHANASGNDYDGRLFMGTSSAFVASGSESHVIGGSLIAESGAAITAGNSSFTFSATTTGKIIRAVSAQTLYDITFSGSGGSWNWISPATTTVSNSFLMNAGTLTGTSSITIQSGDLTGNGSIAMTGGTFTLEGSGSIGGTSPWTFRNLTLGAGSVATTTSTASATTTVTSVLRVASSQVFEAGSSAWVLSGAGTPLSVAGTFDADTAPFWYTATSSTTIADEAYADLYLVPSEAGSPTYTLMGGILSANDVHIGGTSPVTVTANTNDPSLDIAGDVLIGSGSTLVASNVGAFDVGGSWINAGTFTHSSGSITFDSADTGELITPGSSVFSAVTFDNSSGGWTITGNATSSGFTLTNASSFALASGATLEVDGTFTNSVGGAATTWADSILYLNSGTSYSVNAKTVSDTYGTLIVGANTDIRTWNSSAATTTVAASGSLYSQDHANVNGDLYIWGDYVRSTGSDYWNYATDFDGTDLTGTERQVDVRIASSSSLTFSGGLLDIIGAAGATTTVAVQGSGRYSWAVSGGTLNASYYSVRNTTASGLSITGSPTVTSLSHGDFELDIAGGSSMTVDGSVITANPLKIITYNRFATSTGITGYNVTATGSTASSWKFNLHEGDHDGENFDNDPAGDPGYIRWDDSATDITIAGNVYSDEGVTVSVACNGSSPVVSLAIQGVLSTTTPCAAGTGAYSIPDVGFNPGDTITVFLDGAGGRRAANVTIDANTNISDMHLYENRTIVRHEDTSAITIADLALYDSSDDVDIPFTAVDAGSDTLTTAAETKLIVWDGKTFTPGGNVTLESGGSGDAWDGTLEVRDGGTLVATLTESHSVGGSFTLGVASTFTAASSTVTFTATTTGKTITPRSSSFYNMVFNGAGGNWAFTSGATSTNDVTITRGTVTLPSGVFTVGGSFTNSDTFMHNNGTVYLTSTVSGETITASTSPFYSMTMNGSGGQWSFLGGYATTSNDFTIVVGSTTLPTTALSVGGSFVNSGGTFNSGANTVRFTSGSAGETIVPRSSSFASVLFNGSGGEWTWATTSTTVREDFTIRVGSTTLPQGTLTVGGSFVNEDRFAHASGTILFNAADTGNLVTASTSPFNAVTFDSASGGWTVTGSATSSSDFTLTSATSFTLSSGATLEVRGTFTNSVGGAATVWTGSALYLNSGTSYSVNAKTVSDFYEALSVGADTDVRMWNSAASSTVVSASGSLYSQDHANVNGDLTIWGDYQLSSGSDYWSYATDFDGTALGGSSRQVDVRIATSSSVTVSSSGSLAVVGTAAATTTVAVYGSTATYSWSITGGTLNASYYQVRNTDANGLSISGSPAISSLSNGDYELSVNGGTMITVSGAAVDANASMNINDVRFATSSGISSGYNVTKTGSTVNSWNFNAHLGNYDGEAFDSDGVDACGAIRWDDSVCLFVSQEHYRWRNDDGGIGAPDSAWYNASWSRRRSIVITNPNATSYTNVPVEIDILFDTDMQSDFDDLRFTDASGTTSISHFTESVLTSASSTVWVEVPSLPGSSDTVIYVYYGNGSATDGSSGSGTFSFFDDFEDDNITEYTGDTSLFDVDTPFNYEGTYGLDAGANVDQITTSGIRQTGSLTQQGQTLRFYQYVDSGFDDEPCTLFAVQGSGQNYAVCLDQYPADQLTLARDVESNDGSGIELASTTVTWTTGWYEVIVEWLTDDSITVDVYTSSGSLFATISDTDGTYTSGGVGFSFWGQHGGWDYYTARTYVPTAPTYSFGGEQVSGGATWAEDEDTAISGVTLDENIRLRFSIQNTGAAIWDQQFRLQYASKGAALNCASVPYVNYSDVPDTTGGCGSAPACMTTTANFADQDTMGDLLSFPGGLTFATGTAVEDPSNESASSTIPQNGLTEVEYNFELTVNATDPAYCFRVTDGGLDLDNYSVIAEAQLVFPPVITGFTLNGDQPISLTEGATTTIYATSTVTDNNGWEDISFATSTIYRSGVSNAAMCTANDNNCYQIGNSGCSLQDCSGTSCTLSCSADILYFAEATDLTGSYPAENWLSRIYVEDSSGLSDIETATGVELLTLYALGVDTAELDFGAIEVGSTTGSTNQVTGVENTGNTSIDIELSGTDLTADSSSIGVNELVYATSTFTYGACAICQILTGAATEFDVELPKVTSSSTPVSDDIYWGIAIPDGTRALLHEGTNTFIAVSD